MKHLPHRIENVANLQGLRKLVEVSVRFCVLKILFKTKTKDLLSKDMKS